MLVGQARQVIDAWFQAKQSLQNIYQGKLSQIEEMAQDFMGKLAGF